MPRAYGDPLGCHSDLIAYTMVSFSFGVLEGPHSTTYEHYICRRFIFSNLQKQNLLGTIIQLLLSAQAFSRALPLFAVLRHFLSGQPRFDLAFQSWDFLVQR